MLRGPARRVAAMAGGRAAREGLVAGPFYLDAFAERQWDDPNYAGARPKVPKAEFVRRVHELHEAAGGGFADGYAPFCKHVFVPNFVGAAVNCLAITPENEHLVRSGYHARKPGELAVLSRWFPLAAVGPLPEAKMLDIILYSRAQIVLERIAQDGLSEAEAEAELPEVPWGIISIKAQDEAFETPMQPITAMRNALGRAEGGSGVPLDHAKYQEAVDYWSNRAPVV